VKVNPGTPVLIGVGQINQRDDASTTTDPAGLMAAAARRAGEDHVLRAVDAIHVVNLLSWRYQDPGRLLGERLLVEAASTRYRGVGGSVQSLVNQACLDIQAGRANVVLLAGAELWRTRMRLRARGIKPSPGFFVVLFKDQRKLWASGHAVAGGLLVARLNNVLL
jgi:acetyl-CoA C-acetyltransferase